jgi:phosphoglycerol transferase MdoB-like AlkP superfamily enzyme
MLDAAAKPTFVYMLTLSSHEPLDPAVLAMRGKYFNEIKVVHPTQIVTRRAISALVSRLEERANSPCTLIYIVGDHQPPTASAQGNLFAPGKVPYLAFTQSCPAG